MGSVRRLHWLQRRKRVRDKLQQLSRVSQKKLEQVISLAAAVEIYPNYAMIQNWLSTEPSFPPDQEQKTALGDGASPGVVPMLRPPALLVLDDNER
jgi:hypothetical protein